MSADRPRRRLKPQNQTFEILCHLSDASASGVSWDLVYKHWGKYIHYSSDIRQHDLGQTQRQESGVRLGQKSQQFSVCALPFDLNLYTHLYKWGLWSVLDSSSFETSLCDRLRLLCLRQKHKKKKQENNRRGQQSSQFYHVWVWFSLSYGCNQKSWRTVTCVLLNVRKHNKKPKFHLQMFWLVYTTEPEEHSVNYDRKRWWTVAISAREKITQFNYFSGFIFSNKESDVLLFHKGQNIETVWDWDRGVFGHFIE